MSGYQGDQPPRCECHECTQARYRQSFQWQFDQFIPKWKLDSPPREDIIPVLETQSLKEQ